MNKLTFFFFAIVFMNNVPGIAQESNTPKTSSDTLVVLWVSGDIDVAEKSCLMYAHAAKKYEWFSEVILVIWGPSAKLVAQEEEIRDKVIAMQEDGVTLEACVACSNMLGVTEDLRKIGIDVKGMGTQLTDYLKKDYKVLSY